MSKKLFVAIAFFLLGVGIAFMLHGKNQPLPGVPMEEPRKVDAPPVPAPPVKGNKTVMGHVTGYELTANSVKLQVCSNDVCHNVTVTKRTEIIVTNLQGLREVYHDYKSMAEVLNKHKNCNAAVGLEGGNAVMCIIYLTE